MDNRNPTVKLDQNVTSILKVPYFFILYKTSSLWAFKLFSTELLDGPEVSVSVPGPLTSTRAFGFLGLA